MTSDTTAMDMLREKYDQLFSAEKKVVDTILNDPSDVLGDTVAELARKSGVSEASVVRMCHHAGFKGYYQFRVMLARDIGRAPVIREAGSSEELFRTSADYILQMGTEANWNALKASAGLLKSATGQIHLTAVGNTMPLALYMSYRLGRLGVRNTCGVSHGVVLNNINLSEPDDMVIAISHSGASLQVIQALELARDKHLPSIVITASAGSGAAQLADHVLLTGTGILDGYDRDLSHLREMAMIDELLNMITNWERIEKTDAEKTEAMLSEFKE